MSKRSPAPDPAETDATIRRNRGIALAVVAGIAVLAVIAGIAISQTGGDDDGTPAADDDGAPALTGAAEVEAELRGIERPEAAVIGDPDADVVVVEYADLQCPACALYSEQAFPELLDELAREGLARIEFRHFTILGPDSEEAARAAWAAGNQERLFEFVKIFYRNQGEEGTGYVTDEFLRAVAEASGVEDLEAWESDRESDEAGEAVAEQTRQAQALGLQGTPSLTIVGPEGTETQLQDIDPGAVVAAVEQATR